MRSSVDTDSLILSGSIGAGHDTVAEACSEALVGTGVSTTILDCMALMGGWPQRVGDFVFKQMLSHPPLFDAFHFSQLRGGSRLAGAMERGAASRLVPTLGECLSPTGGLLLSVFATGSGAAGRLRARYPAWRTAAVCTDAAAHRMWVQEGVERYIVCSPGAAGTVREYDANADVVELPPPVRAAFFDAPEQSVAQQRLDLDAEKPTVLLTGGGWGRGPITEYSVALADGGYQVLVVAGSNARLAAETRAAAERRPPGSPGAIVSYGYVEQMNTLMAAAHVVVTTPGQTCHEARVVGRPMVLLDAVPGHGRENLLIELASGGAVASLPDPIRVVNAVDAVLDHDVATPTGWPIRDAADWRKRFVAAVADLLPPERPHDRTEFGWTAGPAAYHA
ncbi:MAG TPA: hypothetical protein VGF84_20205 [Micromonosporaceae bacterium]